METLGELAAIWRYPVKSLAAQALAQTQVRADGIPGDRAGALFITAGHARAGKTLRGKEHNLLHTVSDAGDARALASQRGISVVLRHAEHHFDDAAISLVLDTWIAEVEGALGAPLDPRRWRPNFYVRANGRPALRERDLLGRLLVLGTATLRVSDEIRRCVTTTYDVRSGESNPAVLRYVAQERNNVMGVYCEVVEAGTVRAGDSLRLRADWTSRTTASSASM